jgi:cobalt/nickel transport system permease protein
LHIPDGFLDTKTIIATSALSAVGVSVALRHFKAEDQPRKIPLLGLAGAFVFAAQMLNFPVAGGTSGHLIGAVLTAVLLGPSAAVIVITSVLFVQCFLFADGGVLALGANIFNMAIVASLCGYAIYVVIHKIIPGMRGTIIAAAFASWCSAVIASVCCTGELALSGIVPWSTAFFAMTSVHAIIGVGEGLITALVLAAVNATRPELLQKESQRPHARDYTTFAFYGLIVTIGLAIFVAPFASPLPDGLERVSKVLGFEYKAVKQPLLSMPFTAYKFPGIATASISTIAAGVVGLLAVFILSVILAYVLYPKIQDPRQNMAEK